MRVLPDLFVLFVVIVAVGLVIDAYLHRDVGNLTPRQAQRERDAMFNEMYERWDRVERQRWIEEADSVLGDVVFEDDQEGV